MEIDLLVHVHYIIFLLSFCLLSYLFLFPCFPTFFLFYFSLHVLPLFFLPMFWAQWRSFYSACRDQILLFCPLTTFVWSGCTCRPPLVRFHHPPQLQTKKKMFYLLACRSTLSCHDVGVFSLYPSCHAPNSSSPNLASFGWSIIPAGHTSQKSLGRSRKISLFPSPHHQTIPPYLWPMTPPHPILARYKLVVPGLHVCFPFTYVQDMPAAHASTAAWRLACTVCYFSSSFYVGCFIIFCSS